jgi:hypothetical protein
MSRHLSPSSSPWRQSGHRRRQVERGLDPAERVVGIRHRQQLLELVLVEVLDPRLGRADHGPVGELHRVAHTPALAQAGLEDRVDRDDVVADRLDRKGALLDRDVALDVVGRDPVERALAEERHDVVAQVRSDGQPMGLLAALELKPAAELGAALFDRHAPAARDSARRLDLADLAQRLLGLRLGQAVASARGARRPDLALHAPAVGGIPRRQPRSADDSQRAGAVVPAARCDTLSRAHEAEICVPLCTILT